MQDTFRVACANVSALTAHPNPEGWVVNTLKNIMQRMTAQQVRSRFLALERVHLEYVFDSLRRCTTQVRNIHAYLLTALYNAPATMKQPLLGAGAPRQRIKTCLKLRQVF